MVVSHLDAALDLASKGFPVFQCYGVHALSDGRFGCDCGSPCGRDAGKHPHSRYAKKGLLNASTRSNFIASWWSAEPNANIGLVTNSLVVLDIDPAKSGSKSLAQLEGEHGELPHTWRSLTGAGGEHVFFRAPAGSNIRNRAESIAPGIDIRANGGYVVAPPSLHRSGRRYAWSVDHHPDETPLAVAPAWLVELASPSPSNIAAPRRGNDLWRRIVSGVGEGARNDSLTRLAGHLLRRYVDPHVTLELLLALNAARFQPPLDEKEVRKIVGSIASKELVRREVKNGR
jgi:Bifunctional DNA primase/polymerase, N-terminal/Primase C terminal 1 (PriCT-1)